ncbi:MAG: MgtC/SapB family protein [Bacteroidota bacterium]
MGFICLTFFERQIYEFSGGRGICMAVVDFILHRYRDRVEREYRSKAAGLRTMIMICLGSTIFTELSMAMSPGTPDRIASTIVTGVGFLGAGVIFKDGLPLPG